jgi:hypothetical protein
MPDGIIGIAIDIGLIREAQARIQARRMSLDFEDAMASASAAIASFTQAVKDFIDNLDLDEEEPDCDEEEQC